MIRFVAISLFVCMGAVTVKGTPAYVASVTCQYNIMELVFDTSSAMFSYASDANVTSIYVNYNCTLCTTPVFTTQVANGTNGGLGPPLPRAATTRALSNITRVIFDSYNINISTIYGANLQPVSYFVSVPFVIYKNFTANGNNFTNWAWYFEAYCMWGAEANVNNNVTAASGGDAGSTGAGVDPSGMVNLNVTNKIDGSTATLVPFGAPLTLTLSTPLNNDTYAALMPMSCYFTDLKNSPETRIPFILNGCPNVIPGFNVIVGYEQHDRKTYLIDFKAFSFTNQATSTLGIRCIMRLCIRKSDCIGGSVANPCWNNMTDPNLLILSDEIDALNMLVDKSAQETHDYYEDTSFLVQPQDVVTDKPTAGTPAAVPVTQYCKPGDELCISEVLLYVLIGFLVLFAALAIGTSCALCFVCCFASTRKRKESREQTRVIYREPSAPTYIISPGDWDWNGDEEARSLRALSLSSATPSSIARSIHQNPYDNGDAKY